MEVAEQGGYELVRIEGAVFQMGSPESEEGRWDPEGPQHKVQVSDFYIGRYPVTNEQYGIFLREKPNAKEPAYWADRQFNQPRQPVVGMSWQEAKNYAAWAGLRLPSEAEWEYACRAGTRMRFYSGDLEKDLDRVGWYDKNSNNQIHPVAEKEPNAFGLYDMHGNVWEWVEDDWHDDYEGAPGDGRVWVNEPRGALRVIRGGSWNSNAFNCRSANRNNNSPDNRNNNTGFRVASSRQRSDAVCSWIHRQRQCPDHRPGPVPRYNRGQICPAWRLSVGRRLESCRRVFILR